MVMHTSDIHRWREGSTTTRRRLIQAVAVASASTPTLWARANGAAATGQQALPSQKIGEHDERNTKLAHVVPSTLSDESILFLKQIGLRWVVVTFSPAESTLEHMQRAAERFTRQDIRIYGGWDFSYCALKIQLGQPGRDEEIREYQAFLRNLGRLGVPVAPYDFHPANTYTTNFVEHRGYTTREFSVEDFRSKVEQQRFDREYSVDDI